MAWWMGRRVWAQEVANVTQNYPDARWTEGRLGSHPTRVWRLTTNPIPPTEELHCVLADLAQGREVSIHKRGRVGHFPGCEEPWDAHPKMLTRLRLVPRPYVVDLTYPPFQEGGAGAHHPRARLVDPEISHRTHPTHPHLYRTNGDSYACPISPQTTGWSWSRGATLRYLDQVTLWILKSVVWIVTGGGILSSAIWLGPDTPHEPLDLLGCIKPGDPCWCGHGNSYEACHRASDIHRAISATRAGAADPS